MLSDLIFRLRSLFRNSAVENELDDELRFHLEHQVEKHVRSGLTPDDAMRKARLEFGGLGQVKEDCRESRGVSLVETAEQDIRYAFRQLLRTPAFTITVLLTLALGIGANAAIFTLVNAVLLKKLPVADPASLVRLGDNNDCCVGSGNRHDGDFAMFSTDTYHQLKKNVPEFEELAAMQAGFWGRNIIVRRDGNQVARSVPGEFVSGNYFRMFGLQPRAGRLLMDADDTQGAPMTAVMSYEAWQRTYAGDASVVGGTFWINTKPVTIVGITPEGFYGDRMSISPPDFYLPIETMPVLANVPYVHDPEQDWLYIVGRIKPGVAIAPLQQKVTTVLRQTLATDGAFSSQQGKTLLAKVRVVLTPGGAGIQAMQEWYGSKLHLLMWIAGLVLLIACANIANLLLVRGMGRRTEISMRAALGARRGRIVRQLLTESIVLAGMGGMVGLAVAYAGARLLLMLAFPGAHSIPIHAGPSASVLEFACGLSLLTGIVFGVAPALIASHAEPMDALRSGARTTAMGASVVQRGLVVVQVGLSLVLLVVAGLFLQSLKKLEGTDLKLEAKNRSIVHINTQTAGYTQTQLPAFYQTIEERFHGLPGVVKVGIASYTPMEDNNNGWGVQVQGQPYLGVGASVIRANAEYFDSVGTRVVMGRGIDARDTPTATTVAVVNQTFVKDLFKPGENPIGRHFGSPGPESTGDFEIVGVVEDTVYTSVRKKDHLMYFVPMMQRPKSTKQPIEMDDSLYLGAIVLETDHPMNDMEKLTRATLAGINPNLTVEQFQTFDEQIADQFNQERMISQLATLFGILALLLASIGLYGVTAYSVVRRTPEIGIRMALGARRRGVVGMVMRGAMIQTAVGLAIGVPVALLCVRFVKTQLYEITGADFNVMAGSIVMLALAALVAGTIPARRAASIDPVRALRLD
ncbi:MAG TPA: ABC transporter permease [Terracidiphilus sp.]|jgi:predicted permease|nr:ABC transporter permease [Terracidiphilus sp.]